MKAKLPQTEHRYKLKRATLIRNILIGVSFWFVLGIPLLALSAETIAFFHAKDPDPFIFVLARLMLVIVVLLSFTFLLVNFTVIADFFSYIRVTPEGIEQRRSPLRHVKGKWSEAEKISKVQLIQDGILLKSTSRKAESVFTPLSILLPKQPFILLTGYEGWPEGELKDDLKKYAPKLFRKSSKAESA